MASTAPVEIKQNLHEKCEAGLVDLVNVQLNASYAFMAMSMYCDRHDVALPGLHKSLSEQSNHLNEDSRKLMNYLNLRGGRNKTKAINKPEKDEWGTPFEMVTNAIMIYKQLKQQYEALHHEAEHQGDGHLGDFIEDQLLDHAVDQIKKFGDLATQFRRAGNGLGEYLVDHEIHS